MAAKSSSVCLRALRSRPIAKSPIARAFTTSPYRYVEQPREAATPATSIPPVTPSVAPKTSSQDSPSASPAAQKVASSLSKYAGRSASTYTAYGVTESLFATCNSIASYSMPDISADGEIPKTAAGEDLGLPDTPTSYWHTDLALPPTFSTWSQVTMLHMYLLSARFRALPKTAAPLYQQHLLDHFFYAAEDRMSVQHGMHARGTRNRYLKDLFIQWRGLLAAYDEGVVKGDAVLAGALWRNVWKATEDVDVVRLATVVAYMRRVLAALDQVDDEDVMMGRVKFGNMKSEAEVVARRSKSLDALSESKPVTASKPAGKR